MAADYVSGRNSSLVTTFVKQRDELPETQEWYFMIDWLNMIAHSMWILGLALAFSAFSYAVWQAAFVGESIRIRLIRGDLQNTFNWAGILFCVGLATTSQHGWEKGLWLLLALAFLTQVIINWLNSHKSRYLKS